MEKDNFDLLLRVVDDCLKCKVCNHLGHVCYFCCDYLTDVVDYKMPKIDYKNKYMRYANVVS